MSQLQVKNPQRYKMVQNLMNSSNSNPQALLQQFMGNATPEQRETLLKQAKTYGVPDNILTMVQNMK